MAGGSINWYVVVPDATRNLARNPSFEYGTAGWAGTGSPTLGTSSAGQAYGAWALTATGATLGLGAILDLAGQAVAGGTYVASAYVRLSGTNSAGSVQISLGGTSYRAQVGTDWQRISVGSVGAVGSVAVQRYCGAEGTLWADGVQVEAAPITTYIDGDQRGGVWEGAPHASASYRQAQERSGGTIYALAALGLRPQSTPDTGVGPVANILQSYAVNAGAEYQRGRYTERPFTLTGYIAGTTLADQHVARRRVIDAIKRERVTPDQPVRLLYTGAQSTQAIDAYYDSGLGWAGDNAVVDEGAAVRFVAADPMWYDVTQEGASLAPYTVIGSVIGAAYRDPEGRWGTMAGGVTGTVLSVAYADGTAYYGGTFSGAGGTAGAQHLAYWAGGNWGTMGPGTLVFGAGGGIGPSKPGVADIAVRNGTVFIAGNFLQTAAGTPAPGVARWTPGGGWGTLGAGTLAGNVGSQTFAVAFDRLGNLLVGGNFTTANGTVSPGLALWSAAGWGTLSGGTLSGAGTDAVSLAPDAAGALIVSGSFTGAGGTAAGGIARHDGYAWGTFGVDIGVGVASVVTSDQRVYALVAASYTGGGVINEVRAGAMVRPGYINVSSAFGAESAHLVPLPAGGFIVTGYIQTLVSTGPGLPPPFGMAVYNGYTAIRPDLRVATPSLAACDVAVAPDGTWYVGGFMAEMGTAASVTPVANTGISEAFPTLRVRNTAASGTAQLYQLLNTTTGDGLYFDYPLAAGEVVTLVLTPGNRSCTSTMRGNVIGAILPGSNLASWRLLPGTNQVSFFSDGAGVRADLFWTPRSSAIDGGAPGVV